MSNVSIKSCMDLKISVCPPVGCEDISLCTQAVETRQQTSTSRSLFSPCIPCVLRACWNTGAICQEVAYFG